MTTYGQKGGEGPTAGKRSVRFRFEFPDGTVGHKLCFHYQEPTGIAYCYRHDGKWYCSHIGSDGDVRFRHQQTVPATRC